jgi:hypothetical protein
MKRMSFFCYVLHVSFLNRTDTVFISFISRPMRSPGFLSLLSHSTEHHVTSRHVTSQHHVTSHKPTKTQKYSPSSPSSPSCPVGLNPFTYMMTQGSYINSRSVLPPGTVLLLLIFYSRELTRTVCPMIP